MSSLARRSALVLALLFGLLFAVGTAVMWRLDLPIWLAVLFAAAVVGLQFALGPWIIERIYKIRWVEPESVHPEFARWYRESCEQKKIPAPRFGLIDDGNPNAFTYGHTPKDARVVVTTGLLEMLTPAEVHAVVAHELGHVVNRDFIVMTIASAIPIILYTIYVFTRYRGRDRNSGGYAFLIGLGAYVAYIASQYIVLLLSRVREFFADESSAVITRDPNALASALVKISYGLAASNAAASRARAALDPKAAKGADQRPNFASAVSALGICSVSAASGFAIAAADAQGRFSDRVMARAMQWDLKNPWAKWFEFHSTHPLTARRIGSLNRVAQRMGIAPGYDLNSPDMDRNYSSNLPLELLVVALPALGLIGGIVAAVLSLLTFHAPGMLGLILAGFCAGWLFRLAYCYPRAQRPDQQQPRSVESLVGEVDVCHVTAIPCAIEGEIVGRGVPGLFYSKDLVLRDGTGFMRVIYRQPFGILEFLFGWLKGEKYLGRQARVYGWYRRAPVPFIEINRVEMVDRMGGDITCWYVWGNVALAASGLLLGSALALLLR